MINYYFNNAHPLRPFVHSLEANTDSIAPDNALRIAPEFKDGFWACEKNGEWIQVIDLRGRKAYDKQTAIEVEVKALGALPDELTLLEPMTEFDYWDGQGWITDTDKQNASIISNNKQIKDTLLSQAASEISILQDAVDLDMASEEENIFLLNLKRYRVLLNRLDVNDLNAVFPDKPANK